MARQTVSAERKRWEVLVFERKRNPDLGSPLVKIAKRRGLVPQDTVPKKLEPFLVYARKRDQALKAAREELAKRKRTVSALSFSAEVSNRLIAYVFEKESKQ
jgi:hypothetical protein